MFLLARSALCIGLVVAALPDRPAPAPAFATWDGAASAAGVAAMNAVERFCRRDPARCLAAMHGAAGHQHQVDAARPGSARS